VVSGQLSVVSGQLLRTTDNGQRTNSNGSRAVKPEIKKMIRRILIFVLSLSLFLAGTAEARTLLKSICRVKGQEENTLQGLGLVVGLKGTGDGGNFLPTIRSLAAAMQLMGSPLGKGGTQELKDAKNVALVIVTVTIPAAGARQGDLLDCSISSIGGAKSLSGGTLIMTPLQGPHVNSDRVYGFAQGPILINDTKVPTSGRIFRGARLEEDFFNAFSKDGKLTLVLNKNYADFQVAEDVAELINSQLSFQASGGNLAKALNQENIEVQIPLQYQSDPVSFISQVLSLPMLEPQTEARVVINPRSGSIVIGGDVEIGAVVVTHKNMVIETADNTNPPPPGFVAVDTTNQPGSATKLKALISALNAVKVPTDDIIEIIKGLDRDGKLRGTLVVE
jgi:flagellar P-ring protein FlgI